MTVKQYAFTEEVVSINVGASHEAGVARQLEGMTT